MKFAIRNGVTLGWEWRHNFYVLNLHFKYALWFVWYFFSFSKNYYFEIFIYLFLACKLPFVFSQKVRTYIWIFLYIRIWSSLSVSFGPVIWPLFKFKTIINWKVAVVPFLFFQLNLQRNCWMIMNNFLAMPIISRGFHFIWFENCECYESFLVNNSLLEKENKKSPQSLQPMSTE